MPQGNRAWHDGSHKVLTAGGVPKPKPVVFYLGLPFRRLLSWNWLVPIGRIGGTGAELYGLSSASSEFVALTTGRFYLFANDAVLPWPFWKILYANNTGVTRRVKAGDWRQNSPGYLLTGDSTSKPMHRSLPEHLYRAGRERNDSQRHLSRRIG